MQSTIHDLGRGRGGGGGARGGKKKKGRKKQSEEGTSEDFKDEKVSECELMLK